jgi:segregation and condensation protein B
MDEISRELPIDTTTGRTDAEPGKGPAELVAFERNTVAENLVVRSRFEPSSEPTGEPDGMGALAVNPDTSETPDNPEASRAPSPAGEPVPEAPETGAETAPEAVEETAPEAVDAAAAAQAIAAEAETAVIEDEAEEDLADADDEGLPPVPELADAAAVARQVFVLMLSSREGLSLLRLAQACNTTQKLVEEALAVLQQQLQGLGLPVELARSGDSVKWMSAAETFPYLQRLRGVKKLEKLSPAALETLAVIAYRQPVMRSEIEAIRGVKAGPMLRTLLHHKLVKVTGRADVPGRPLQYGTTPQFLERFGLGSLQELPSIKEWKSLG